MSRQYNQAVEGCFELYGKEYKLIEPENIEELMKALEVKALIENYIGNLMHDDDSSGYENLLEDQNAFIHEYVESLGEFDNSILADNISYLAKKYNLRIGELEETIGVSAGYLSRTLKENSKKKMSIDIVWKIARLFGTDIRTLTETEMRVERTNAELLERFLERLYKDTQENRFVWEPNGGAMFLLHDRYKETGLVTIEEDSTAVYHPDHMEQECKWVLADDIFSLECFDGKKDFAIIPYRRDGKDEIDGYDFVFLWEDEGRWHWEKVFYTSDDSYHLLKDSAHRLYQLIWSKEFDVKVSPKVHQFISNYVKGGRTE